MKSLLAVFLQVSLCILSQMTRAQDWNPEPHSSIPHWVKKHLFIYLPLHPCFWVNSIFGNITSVHQDGNPEEWKIVTSNSDFSNLFFYLCKNVWYSELRSQFDTHPRSVQWNGVMTLAPISALDDSLPASRASLSGSTSERGSMYNSREWSNRPRTFTRRYSRPFNSTGLQHINSCIQMFTYL